MPCADESLAQTLIAVRSGLDSEGPARAHQIGSEHLIMPDTCPGQPAARCLAC